MIGVLFGCVEIEEELKDEDDGSAGGLIQTRAERKKEYKSKLQQLNDKKRRKWLIKHGKGHVLDFHDE